jgi:nucleoside-diphosphate-sugar epimerase
MTTPLRVLVLGGTSWLGGAIARHAVDRGHEVTCLARGKSGEVPPGVEWVSADRWDKHAYEEVTGQDWDAVVDVSWQPNLVRSAVGALAPTARQWIYVSSLSVYQDDSEPGADESAAVHPPWTGSGEVSIEQYGPAKVACETACLEALPAEQVLVARAGLIAGYGDRSDRFGYWPARVARSKFPGEEVLVVDSPDQVAQLIDVEDLARWLVDCVAAGRSGTFNAMGDAVPVQQVLDGCVEAVGQAPTWVPVQPEWLEAESIEPWAGQDSIPLWLPLPAYAGFMTRRNDAAKAAGLSLRPLSETISASLAWEQELGLDRDRSAGLSATREAELLAAWRQKTSS